MSRKHIVLGFVFLLGLVSITFLNKPSISTTLVLEKAVHQGRAMGTSFSVVYFYQDQDMKHVVPGKVDQAIKLVNDQMSTYKEDSHLSKFNKKPKGSCFQFPPEAYHVISMAQSISELSNGAFDITVGPLVNLWGFGPNYNEQKAPSDDQIRDLKIQKVGYKNLVLKENNLVCKTKDIYVDLSAIAKGYAVDLVAERLDSLGIKSYLVEIGGELKAKGVKPSSQSWRIAIEEPELNSSRSVHKVVQLHDVGIATSGDYRNYFEQNGKRFSHTIDPNTGKPIDHRLASVSVLHDSVAYADAMATALNVIGPDNALALAKSEGLGVYLLVKTDHGFEAKSTEIFDQAIID